MVLKFLWNKILFIKLTNSSKHSLILAKTGINCRSKHHFGALQHPFGFAPHTLRLKFVFRVVSCHFVAAPDPLWNSVSGALNARVYASGTISCFAATNMPNPLFQSKTHFLGGSMPFRSRTGHIAKTGIEAHLMHEFKPLEPFLVFWQ